jgi:excisionase family DNA binding protein
MKTHIGTELTRFYESLNMDTNEKIKLYESQDQILTINDVVEHFKICESKVRSLVKHNQIPHTRIGNSIRFRKNKLDEWFDSKANEEQVIKHKELIQQIADKILNN